MAEHSFTDDIEMVSWFRRQLLTDDPTPAAWRQAAEEVAEWYLTSRGFDADKDLCIAYYRMLRRFIQVYRDRPGCKREWWA